MERFDNKQVNALRSNMAARSKVTNVVSGALRLLQKKHETLTDNTVSAACEVIGETLAEDTDMVVEEKLLETAIFTAVTYLQTAGLYEEGMEADLKKLSHEMSLGYRKIS